jgi:hypothetical protein
LDAIDKQTFPPCFFFNATITVYPYRSIKDVFNWDDKGTRKKLKKSFNKHKRRSLSKEFELVEAQRSHAFNTYIASMEETSSSVNALQIAIRTSPVLPAEFDYYLHEDYRIAEKLLGHL